MRFEDKLRARAAQHFDRPLGGETVTILASERDALADAIAALRMIADAEPGGKDDEDQALRFVVFAGLLQSRAKDALARLDAAPTGESAEPTPLPPDYWETAQ